MFAVCLFTSFLPFPSRWIIIHKGFPISKFSEGPLQFFIFAVTILVRIQSSI